MHCMKCGSEGSVLNSRKSLDSKNAKFIPNKFAGLQHPYTYRDCKCKKCGDTYQTVEMTMVNLESFFRHESIRKNTIMALEHALRELGK